MSEVGLTAIGGPKQPLLGPVGDGPGRHRADRSGVQTLQGPVSAAKLVPQAEVPVGHGNDKPVLARIEDTRIRHVDPIGVGVAGQRAGSLGSHVDDLETPVRPLENLPTITIHLPALPHHRPRIHRIRRIEQGPIRTVGTIDQLVITGAVESDAIGVPVVRETIAVIVDSVAARGMADPPFRGRKSTLHMNAFPILFGARIRSAGILVVTGSLVPGEALPLFTIVVPRAKQTVLARDSIHHRSSDTLPGHRVADPLVTSLGQIRTIFPALAVQVHLGIGSALFPRLAIALGLRIGHGPRGRSCPLDTVTTRTEGRIFSRHALVSVVLRNTQHAK